MSLRKNHTRASAPAKVILLGEHFVVYDKPAILGSIDKRVYVDVKARKDSRIVIKSNMGFSGSFDQNEQKQLRIKKFKSLLQPVLRAANDAMKVFAANVGVDMQIRSEFPYGVGLGYSAACSVATIAAVSSLFGKLSRQKICEMSLNAERLVHTNPSGADSAICTYGGLMLFSKDAGAKQINHKIDLKLIVVNSGIKRITGKLVSNVMRLRVKDANLFYGLLNMSENITSQALNAIKRNDYAELGALMTLNHSLLRRLGVSRNTLDKLVDIALKNNALGAKVTGAGGGGCIIALVNDSSKNKVVKSMKSYDVFVSKVEHRGLVIES
ncbi:MAG: mevalonate kinase [Nitrososphaerales archaeon]